MTAPIVLIVPPGLDLPGGGQAQPGPEHLQAQPRCEVRTYLTAGDAAGALRRQASAFVLVVQEPDADELEHLAEAARRARAPVVAVELEPWDGEAHSPLSAACRGVIAGFGAAGVAAALDLVAAEMEERERR